MCFTLPLFISVAKKPVNGLIITYLLAFFGEAICQERLLYTPLPTHSETVIAELSNHYQWLSNNTLKIAQQKKWPLIKNYANDKLLTLYGVDFEGSPIYYTTHNMVASTGTHTDALQLGGVLGLNLSGRSADLDGRLGVWDGGLIRVSHVEMGERVRNKNTALGLSDHATHIVGTIAAKGVNVQAKGMASEATIDVWDYNDDIFEMSQAARKLLISNHAYGPVIGWVYNASRPGNNRDLKWEWWGSPTISSTEDYRFGFYDEKAKDFDKLAFNSPYYLIVKSADNKRSENGPPANSPYFLKDTDRTSTLERSKNDSYDIIPSEATAKNILTIGAADVTLSNGRLNGFVMTDFSGWGPTDDGRIKPDLLGVGAGIISPIAVSNNAYATYSGTSTATANVSGALLLLQELYYQRNTYYMRSATLKGLVLHTAEKPDRSNAPNYEYGWGLLNTEKAANVLTNKDKIHFIDERSLKQDEMFQRKFVAQGNGPLVATICWTDPEATATAISTKTVNDRTPKLVNDLDIRIDDGSQSFMPWVLDPQHPTAPAKQDDNIRDNVEQVYIANAKAGETYTVTIVHKNKLRNGSQPFSLIVSGLEPQDCVKAAQLITGADTVLCGGSRMKITAKGGNGFVYDWYKDGVLIASNEIANFTVATEGIYAVKVNGYQCAEQSKDIRVRTTTLSSAIFPTNSVVVCPDKPIKFTSTAVNLNYRYQWQLNGKNIQQANKSEFYAAEAGLYTLALTADGCTATSKATNVLSAVERPLISTNTGVELPSGGSIKLTTNVGDGMTYQWYLNNKAIPTAKASRYLATVVGEYTVKISQNGCTLESKPLAIVGKNGSDGSPVVKPLVIDKASLRLSPNPAKDKLTVIYESEEAYELEATITNLQGLQLQSAPLDDNGEVFYTIFDIAKLPPGSYLLKVSNSRKSITKLFIKF